MALLPPHPTDRNETCTTGPRLRPIVADVPLTDAEKLELARDYRLIDGIHAEYLDRSQRDHLAWLCWAIETGRVSELI